MKFSTISFRIALFTSVFVIFFNVSTCEQENSFNNSSISENKTAEILVKWKNFEKQVKKMSSSIFKAVLPFAVSSMDMNLSSSCSKGLMKMLLSMKQMKTWAFQMLDSSGKFPNGMLATNLNSLGEYDTCLNIEVPGHFHGQYCTVKFLFPLPERRPFTSGETMIPEFVNFTDPTTVTALFLRYAKAFYFLNFRTSFCLPSTCSTGDVQKIVNKLVESSGTGFEAEVMRCEQKEDVVLSTSDIAVISVLCILVSLGIAATIVDVFSELTSHEEQSSRHRSFHIQCLLCFSFYTNTKRLLKKDDSPESIKIFHGMKVITVLWVILNHSYYYTNIQVIGSLVTVTEWRRKIAFQLMGNGFLNVETFFFITAVLVSYGVTRMPGKSVNVGLYILRRLWRLTPPFMLVIATSFLVPYFGSGPVWTETVVEGLINKCKKNWWKNLLYFNNFVPVSETCFPWMWYLPADTHLYIIALVFLIPLKSNVKVAFVMNGVLLAAGTCATIFNNYYYQLHPTAITAFTHPEDGNYFANYGYFRSYLHLSTYCVGMTVGYIIAKRKEMRIPLVANVLGWLVSSVAALTVLYGVYEWNQGHVPSLAISTLYTCTNKFVWSLALGWVTVICMTGNGGIVTKILSWQAFVPFSRLTYMAYLVHPIIQFMYAGSTRVLIRADHRTFVIMYLGYVLTGFMSAFVFSLLFESPFMALEKVILAPKKRTDRKELPKNVEAADPSWKVLNLTSKSKVYSVSGNQVSEVEKDSLKDG